MEKTIFSLTGRFRICVIACSYKSSCGLCRRSSSVSRTRHRRLPGSAAATPSADDARRIGVHAQSAAAKALYGAMGDALSLHVRRADGGRAP